MLEEEEMPGEEELMGVSDARSLIKFRWCSYAEMMLLVARGRDGESCCCIMSRRVRTEKSESNTKLNRDTISLVSYLMKIRIFITNFWKR